MCAQVLDRQLSRGMSASDSAKVIRHGNTLPNSPRGRLANPPLQQIIQRATAILEVAHQLNKKTGHRIKYKKVDAETGDEVEQVNIIKGYEVGKGDYIEIDPEGPEAGAFESERTIEVHEFA